jgi:hypothetical protein
VRILNAVEHDVKAAAGCGFLERGVAGAGSIRDDALMRGSRRSPVQLLARLKADGNAAFTAEIDQFLKATAGRAFGNHDAVEREAGFERFTDGMDSCKQGH